MAQERERMKQQGLNLILQFLVHLLSFLKVDQQQQPPLHQLCFPGSPQMNPNQFYLKVIFRFFSLHLLPFVDLMEKILQLSHCESNFTSPPPDELLPFFQFNFQEKIPQVMSLLSLDHNLARLHAKISPKMDEEIFWKNYYARIFYLRYRSGIDSLQPIPPLDSLKEDKVIFISNSSGCSPGKVASSTTSPVAAQATAVPPPSPQTSSGPSTTLTAKSSPRLAASPSPSPSKTSPSVIVQRESPEMNSSDWDTCDDIKEPGKGSKSSRGSAVSASTTAAVSEVKSSHSKKLSEDIENMKKVEIERMKQREAEAAALAAEVRHPPFPSLTSSLAAFDTH
jgi:hypothetical protein